MISKHRIISMVIAAVLLASTLPAHPETPQRHVKLLTIEDGLSQSTVTCMLQDSSGFMWFGTTDGLNRYDGNQFKIYYLDEGSSIGNNENAIRALHEFPAGVLWIATNGGLVRFDQAEERFTWRRHNPGAPGGLNDNIILGIGVTPDGSLWVGARNGGLNRLDTATGRFTHYLPVAGDPHSLAGYLAHDLLVDRAHTLWLAASGELHRYDPGKDRFDRFKLPPPPPASGRNDNNISCIYEDKQGILWVATLAAALYRFDRAAERFEDSPLSIGYDHPNPGANVIVAIHEDTSGIFWVGAVSSGFFTLDRTTGVFTPFRKTPFPFARSMYEDRSGVLWLGSLDGIAKLNSTAGGFSLFRLPTGNMPGAPVNVVYAVLEDHLGFLWFGVEGGGLMRQDRADGRITRFSTDTPGPGKLNSTNIGVIYQDSSNVLWIGTDHHGLFRFHRDTETFTPYPANHKVQEAFRRHSIYSIVEGNNRELWVASRRDGLYRFRRGGRAPFNIYRHHPDNPDSPDSPGSNFLTTLHRDRRGNIWVGTDGGGVSQFSQETETFTRYSHQLDNPNSISSNYILSISEDKEGRLWFGAAGGGFNKFNRDTGVFTRYSRKDGLPNNMVYCIEADDNGFLWLSTNRGLSRFDPDTETFENYDVHDGLQSNEFNAMASYKSRTGELFFGGINGLNSFFPGKMKKNPFIPPVVITDVKLFNKSMVIGPDSPLKKAALFTDSIRLRHHENFFSFQFAALDFTNPGKNRYAYTLEGFDRDWVYRGASNRNADYTNVEPGEYVFRVIASNNDGVWNEQGTSIRVIITPPFWRTLWFRLLVLLLILASGYKTYNIRVRYLSLKIRGEMRMNALLDKHKISEREKEIVQLLLKGKNNKEIEELLFISPHTVKNHIYNIYKKFNVNTRSQLITLINGSISHPHGAHAPS